MQDLITEFNLRRLEPKPEPRPLSKSYYLKRLLVGKLHDPMLHKAAFIYYHSGIPLEDALVYIETLSKKISKPVRVL